MTDNEKNKGTEMSQEDIDALVSGGADTVSQDDIDSLLGMTSEPVEVELPTPSPLDARGVRPLDLVAQERNTKTRMPTMEVLNDRFSRSFRGSLFSYLRVNADILPMSAQMIKYGDFIGKINLPAYFVMASMTPLHGSILFILDPYFCYGIIEAFFGGNGRIPPKLEGRDFSVIEQRVFNNVVENAIRDFVQAWEPIVKLEMRAMRSDAKAQFVGIATASEIVVASSFEIEMERWRGKFFICFPYIAVEPFREQLVSGVAPDQSAPDLHWQSSLRRDIQDAKLNSYALLASKEMLLHDALRLKEGSLLEFDRPDKATLYVEDIPVADGEYGVHRGKYALRVTLYRQPDEEDLLRTVTIKREIY